MNAEPAANPFAQDVAEPLPGPTTLVIFGATGDLAARKLLPAIYNLRARRIAAGALRSDRDRQAASDTEAFRHHAREAIAAHSRTGIEGQRLAGARAEARLPARGLRQPELFEALRSRIEEKDGDQPAQRVFYLAVSASFFGAIAKALAAAGLGAGADPPTRLMIEKPFGRDLASARALAADLSSAFDESQVFRIDHYLGKETVQNLQVLRFANGILEPIWNRRYVEHVQITMAEDIGIGHRAGYYDSAGAIRDVIQNHLMQLLALVAMEAPVRFDADTIRDEKVKLLRSVRRYRPTRSPTTRSEASTAPAGSAGRRSPPTWTRRACRTTRAPRRTSRCGWRSTTGAGRGPRSTCAREAPAPPGDRDRGALSPGAASAVRALGHRRRRAERDGALGSARRGRFPAAGRQGPRPDDERQARADGVQLRRLVPGRLPRGL